MNRTKNYVTFFVILIMIGFFVWAILPKDDFSKKVSETLKKEQEKADVLFKDATLAEIYDGVKYWELIAKSATINKSTGVADLSNVDGVFFDKGRPTMKFIAPSAVWHIDKNEIRLKNPIGYDSRSEKLIKTELAKVNDLSKLYSLFYLPESSTSKFEGYWFFAKNLNWKLATKKLLCTGSISLTKGNVKIFAEKLESDVGLNKVVLTGNPRAEVKSDSTKINTSAKMFYVDSSSDIILADQNVVITRDKAKIRTSRSNYNPKKRLMELRGDVYITDGPLTAYSRTAYYDIKASTVILTDKAKAKRGGNEVYGQKITILLGQNKIIVEGRSKAKIKEAEIK